MLLCVRDDADNLDGLAEAGAGWNSKVLAERPGAAKELARQLLVDDGDLWQCRRVTLVEVTAGKDRCSDGREVPLAHLVHLHARILAGRGRNALDIDRDPRVGAERRAPRRACGGDARNRAHAFEDATVRHTPLLGRDSSQASGDADQNYAFAPEPWVERDKSPPTAEQEAGARDHHERQRDLRNDQRFTRTEPRMAFSDSASARFQRSERVNMRRAPGGRQRSEERR